MVERSREDSPEDPVSSSARISRDNDRLGLHPPPVTREEILVVIGALSQNPADRQKLAAMESGHLLVVRELSDDDDVYVLEVQVAGEKPGEMTEYRYQRKGKFGKNETTTTHIAVVWYEKGEGIGGKTIANYDEKETGKWRMAT